MRRRVAALTGPLSLMTRETVATETSASRATSRIVAERARARGGVWTSGTGERSLFLPTGNVYSRPPPCQARALTPSRHAPRAPRSASPAHAGHHLPRATPAPPPRLGRFRRTHRTRLSPSRSSVRLSPRQHATPREAARSPDDAGLPPP